MVQKKGRFKKSVAVISALALVAAATGSIGGRGEKAKADDYGISNPRVEKDADGNVKKTTWDKVKFGNYYQTAKFEEPEPIKWRILSVDEEKDDLFLLADQCLDGQPYNETEAAGPGTSVNVTWETCTLRSWLNGYGTDANRDGKDYTSENFMDSAFTDEEKKDIKETMVVNEDTVITDDEGDEGMGHVTEGGNDTKDKVYLLSIAEASNAVYGFDETFDNTSDTRTAKNTDYAKVQGANTVDYQGNGNWWLRSSGDSSYNAAYVDHYGLGHYHGGYAIDDINAVRPALHISRSSALLVSAGTVDATGNTTETDGGYNNPVVIDGVTTWDCVYFGSYRQSATFKKEPIEWRVLSVDKENDDMFLLTDKNLDCQPYDKTNDSIWENCTLRSWLNGYGTDANTAGKDYTSENFMDSAFTDEEKKDIKETMVVNEDTVFTDYEGVEHMTEGGKDTVDKVYLLSIAEVSNKEYGFGEKFASNSDTRWANNTGYAKYLGNDSAWWLRSPGYNSYIGAEVDSRGSGNYMGNFVYYGSGIRPVLHLSLSSPLWSYAGTVNSGGKTTDGKEDTETSASPERETDSTPEALASTRPDKTPAATPDDQPDRTPASETTAFPTLPGTTQNAPATDAPALTASPDTGTDAAPTAAVTPGGDHVPGSTADTSPVWSGTPSGTPGIINNANATSLSTPASASNAKDTSGQTTVTCKKVKAAKKTCTIKKKGKTIKVVFNLTTTPKNSLTKEKVTATVKDKKIATVTKKKLTKKKLTVTVKGKKKGKTTLTVKVGKKSAKATIKVKK